MARNSRLTVNANTVISAAQVTIRTRTESSPPFAPRMPVESAGEGLDWTERSDSPATPLVPAATGSPKSNRRTSALGSDVTACHPDRRIANSFSAGPRAIAGQT